METPAPILAQRQWKQQARPLIIAALVLGAGVYLFAFDPTKVPMPQCVFHTITGLDCPGCGASRALHALLHGEVRTAMGFNPLFVVMLPVLGLMYLWHVMGVRRGRRADPFLSGLKARAVWAILAVLCAYGVMRNLPWYPFTLLAP